MQHLPAISVGIPFAFALLTIICVNSKETVQKAVSVTGSALTMVAVSAMWPVLVGGGQLGAGPGKLDFPLKFSFGADTLSLYFALIFAFCFLLAFIYSLGYISHGHAKNRYLALMLIFEGAMMGVVLTSSLLGLFVFFEIMTISAYLLIIHEEDEVAMFAGAKFLYMSLAAGLCIFFGLVGTYYLAGRVDFLPGGYITYSPIAVYVLFAFLLGFGVKAGMFPVHIWLPDAHPAAPAPVSALLSGCSIKTGVYGIIRVMHDIYGIDIVKAVSFDRILLVIAIITILLGSALALQQDQLKRRLAYSSVAQIGYILLGVSMLTERAMFGALFHIFSHAMMKSTLFLCAGAIIAQTGKKYISQMGGIGYRLPATMLSFSLAAMTIVGLPPFIAFISKTNLALAAIETGRTALVLVLITSSMLNAFYYFPIVITAFFAGNSEHATRKFTYDRLPAGMTWVIMLMAACCLIFAFFEPNWPVILVGRISEAMF